MISNLVWEFVALAVLQIRQVMAANVSEDLFCPTKPIIVGKLTLSARARHEWVKIVPTFCTSCVIWLAS